MYQLNLSKVIYKPIVKFQNKNCILLLYNVYIENVDNKNNYTILKILSTNNKNKNFQHFLGNGDVFFIVFI